MLPERENMKFVREGIALDNEKKNAVYYSELNEYFSSNAFRNFSIKIPLQGTVRYRTEKGETQVSKGSFLLGCMQEGKVIVDDTILVKSICIDIDEHTISEAFNAVAAEGKFELDNLEAEHFSAPHYFDNKYVIRSCRLGSVLSKTVQDILKDEVTLDDEFFFSLAQEVILHELMNNKSLAGIKAVQVSTRREILSRLYTGKAYIEDNFLKNPAIQVIAKECSMSPFNFFRNFRQAFGVTPYQYMLSKRLEHARLLIVMNHSLKQVASVCGFPDIFTFSKAFKRTFGVAPSHYKSSPYHNRENSLF
ncbi:MAG: helix-turn-helix transcriptional regulator [Bacteroidetes bacterium]|nr:helix-turn-helix transcriptional regulator [Bacteroidota bacterium]